MLFDIGHVLVFQYNRILPMDQHGGRNNDGKMTMRHMGGGHKQVIAK